MARDFTPAPCSFQAQAGAKTPKKPQKTGLFQKPLAPSIDIATVPSLCGRRSWRVMYFAKILRL
jgi:hypothetical protein